jgi:tetratricopeptide (TPR) repeat protein
LFFVLSLIFGIVTLFSQEEAKFLLNTHNYPLLNKIGIFGYGIFHYISKFLIPINLSAFYSYPQSLTSITLIGILTLMAFFLLVYTLVKFNQHLVLFGLFIFVVNIILVLQIVPFGDAIVADRYMYLPIIGLVLAVIYIAERFQFPKIVTVAVALVFCGISFVRSGLWKDSLPLFLNVIKTNPTSFIAINSLGVEYMERNDFDKSYRYLNQIVKLYPNYYKGYYNRGLLNGKTKRHKQAIFDFSKAIEYKNYYKAYAGRATVYYELKDFPKARADAEKTIQLEENNIKANYVLANCYDDLNDLPKAVMYYNKSILLNSENPLYYLRRAIVYGKMQQFNLCLQDLDRCLSINPNYAEAYYWKGVAKVNMRQNPCSDLKRALNLGFLEAQQPLINYCK